MSWNEQINSAYLLNLWYSFFFIRNIVAYQMYFNLGIFIIAQNKGRVLLSIIESEIFFTFEAAI